MTFLIRSLDSVTLDHSGALAGDEGKEEDRVKLLPTDTL